MTAAQWAGLGEILLWMFDPVADPKPRRCPICLWRFASALVIYGDQRVFLCLNTSCPMFRIGGWDAHDLVLLVLSNAYSEMAVG